MLHKRTENTPEGAKCHIRMTLSVQKEDDFCIYFE